MTAAAPIPGTPGARRISNGPLSPVSGEAVPFSTLHAIAAGVPKSFPFHSIAMQFHSTEFGDKGSPTVRSGEMIPGVLVTDSWWANGRKRSRSACMVVEVDAGSRSCLRRRPRLQRFWRPAESQAHRADAIGRRSSGGCSGSGHTKRGSGGVGASPGRGCRLPSAVEGYCGRGSSASRPSAAGARGVAGRRARRPVRT